MLPQFPDQFVASDLFYVPESPLQCQNICWVFVFHSNQEEINPSTCKGHDVCEIASEVWAQTLCGSKAHLILAFGEK